MGTFCTASATAVATTLTHHAALLPLFPAAQYHEDNQQQHHAAEYYPQYHVEHLAARLSTQPGTRGVIVCVLVSRAFLSVPTLVLKTISKR